MRYMIVTNETPERICVALNGDRRYPIIQTNAFGKDEVIKMNTHDSAQQLANFMNRDIAYYGYSYRVRVVECD